MGWYAYGLREGHWKLDAVVLGKQGMVEGQLLLHEVMPITGLRACWDHMEEGSGQMVPAFKQKWPEPKKFEVDLFPNQAHPFML